ncbi:hypothetical protein LTA6_001526 [Microbacterium sp. LTA6]|uniref:hypothetical protein n=1 Tax=Microbacterium sp. LTA6 TaxID=3129771 RepID=UPI003245DC19
MPAQALLFAPPRGVLIAPKAADDFENAKSQLPDDVPDAERVRVLTAMAQDAADTDATVALVWQEDFGPFGLWIQITPIPSIRLARAFVKDEADGWIGPLRAELIGEGLEWFSPAADQESTPRWSAVFADDDLFVNVTLTAPSFADLVARRALVESAVLPSLVIAADAEPWRADERLASGVIVAKESWPHLSGTSA